MCAQILAKAAASLKKLTTNPSGAAGVTPEMGVESGRFIFPVSDDAGYEVVGNFRYGRGLMINRTGDVTVRTVGDAPREQGYSVLSNDRMGFGAGVWPAEMIASIDASPGVAASSTGLPRVSSDPVPTSDTALPATATGSVVDPRVGVLVDAVSRGRTLAELAPGFTYNQSSCACTTQRADNLMYLVQSGGVFSVLTEFLNVNAAPVVALPSKIPDDEAAILEASTADNIMMGANLLRKNLQRCGENPVYGVYGYGAGIGAAGTAYDAGAFSGSQDSDLYLRWLANVFWMYRMNGGTQYDVPVTVVNVDGTRYWPNVPKVVAYRNTSLTRPNLDAEFEAAGGAQGVDPIMLKSIAMMESTLGQNAQGKPRKDRQVASGVMQIIPKFAEENSEGTRDPWQVVRAAYDEKTKKWVAKGSGAEADNAPSGPSYADLMSKIEEAIVTQNAQRHMLHRQFEDEVAGKPLFEETDPASLPVPIEGMEEPAK